MGSWLGYILTGGQSRRMGSDKALLAYRGATLLEWVASCVAQATGAHVTLVGTPDRYAHLPYPAIADPHAGSGPLSGIAAALDHAAPSHCLIVACDMPLLYPRFLAELLQYGENSNAEAIIPRGSHSGYVQPLCALYRQPHCRDAAQQALAAGRFKILDALSGLRIDHWPVDDEEVFSNANTPEEWARISRTGTR